jgi:hypothetical protein
MQITIGSNCVKRMSWMLSLSSKMMFLIVVGSLLIDNVAAEESTNEARMDDGKNTVVEEEEEEEAWYMILVLSLLFGFFISAFGCVLGYFSLLEDKLMRHYQLEGKTIMAEIVSSTLVRSGDHVAAPADCGIIPATKSNPTTSGRDVISAEFVCFCEYDWQLTEGYKVRIRKQCKVKSQDFVSSPPSSSSIPNSPRKGFPTKNEYMLCDSVDERLDSSDRELVEMLILPGYERSALPKSVIERACNLQYRLYTMGLLIFQLLLVSLCLAWAISDVQSLQHDIQRTIGWWSIVAFLVSVFLVLALVPFCGHQILVDALVEEYLNNGEYVPRNEDSFSLGSQNSDTRFSFSRHTRTSSSFISA